MLSLLKATGGPGSIPFFVLAIAIGLFVIYIWPKRRRLGLVWILGVTAIYAVLALPVTAHAIADGLPAVARVDTSGSPIPLLIVLDGDNRRGRARVAQQIVASNRPEAIWVLGSSWMIDPLLQAGVPDGAARHDPTAANTLEQMQQVATMAADVAPGRTVVIASRLQAPRVVALAAAFGTAPDIVPAPVDDEPPSSGLWRFIPRYIALRLSRDALYEHAALWWYARQGWIEPVRARSTAR